MNDSSLTLPEQFQEHREALQQLFTFFDEFSIPFFLIGAQARDIHFSLKNIKPVRVTGDLDFAIMVDSMDHYTALLDGLQKIGFESTSLPYRMIWPQGATIIDLLPFGQIEQNHHIHFINQGIELSVLGYREMKEELQFFHFEHAPGLSIPLPPLHGIFILKIISWDDKKPDRKKDLQDMSQILKYFWDFVEEEAYEQHLDLFNDEFDIHTCAARILGRHLAHTLKRSEQLKERVIQVLKQQISDIDRPGLMLRTFAEESDKPLDVVQGLLGQIIQGIEETRK